MSADFLHHLTALSVPIFTAALGSGRGEFRRPDDWQALTPASNGAQVAGWRPGDGLAGVMGGNVAVIDVDTKNGGDPDRTRQLLDALNIRVYADVLTPSGGRHYYVPGHADLPTVHATTGRDGLTGHPGVEIISFGANVFLPGTQRPKYDGAGYVVLDDNLEALADGGDPESGEALAYWVSENRARPAVSLIPSEPWDGAPPDTRQAAYLTAVLDRQVAQVASMGANSGRNAALYTAALICGSFVAGAGMDEQETIRRLTKAAHACGLTKEDGPRSVAASIASGLKNGRRNPRAVPPANNIAHVDGLSVDTGTGEITDPPQDALEESAGDRARRLFPRLDWHALWDDDTEEEWIHEPLIPARRSVVIYSPPKAGKSLLMLELAVAVSRGSTFLGYDCAHRRRVLYVDFENDPRGDVRSRLQAMGCSPDDLDHLDYLSFPQMAGLDTERGSLEMLEAVKAYGSELVVIDTVSRAVDGEENSNDTWLGLYRHTGLKLKRAGVAVVRLDHTGKDEAKGQRGGSAKSGDVDAIWRLTKITDERFRLECTDSRLQITTKSLQLTRHQTPRLHHTVEVLGAMTDHDAKVAHLVDLCTSNSIPADANRESVRTFAASRGIKASGRVVQDVIRRRKGELSAEFTPPSGDLNGRQSSPSSAAAEPARSEHENGELMPKVHLSSPPPGVPELSAAVRSTAEQFTPLTCPCGEVLSELRATYYDRCPGCERAAS